MKIFISWSGVFSHEVALALREWLPLVVQAAKPFVSSEDIRSGSRWLHELSGTLEEYSIGIACLTPENLDERWINFEAGALSKSVASSRLMCLLIGMKPTDIIGPLSQFQITPYREHDVLKMVMSINESASESSTSEEVIRQTFAKFWPELQVKLDPITERVRSTPEGREVSQFDLPTVLEEILSLVRSQQNVLYNRLPPNDPASVRVSRETTRMITANWVKVERFLNTFDPGSVPEEVFNASTMISNHIIELVADETAQLYPGVDFVDVGKWKQLETRVEDWMRPEPARLRRIVIADSSQKHSGDEGNHE